MKRIAIFAHYSKNNFIEDYVIYLIKEIKKCVEKIIFISDSNINEDEIQKIKEFIYHYECKPHGEYDFGSYKKGFLWAKENNLLPNCEELIFINDSCYGPLYPFEETFNKMSGQPIDFWGLTKNYNEIKPHIQSYFLVFKPQVFNSKIFEDFIYSIKHEENKIDIVEKYEIGLTEYLNKNGFNYNVFSNLSTKEDNVYLIKAKKLIKEEKLPLLKRCILLRRELKYVLPWGFKKVIKESTNYPYEFIEKDIQKHKLKIEFSKLLEGIRKFIIKIHLKERKFAIFNNWYKY